MNFSGNHTSFSLALPDSEFALAISSQPVKEQSHIIAFTSYHPEFPMLGLISSETCQKCAEIHRQDMWTCKYLDKRNMPSLLVKGSQAVSLSSVTVHGTVHRPPCRYLLEGSSSIDSPSQSLYIYMFASRLVNNLTIMIHRISLLVESAVLPSYRSIDQGYLDSSTVYI